MTNSQKDIWRARWLSSINELTSFELQKKSWLDTTHTNPHWSFAEFMSCYFDDLVIDDNYKHSLEIDWVAKQEYETIKDWHLLLVAYVPPKNDYYDCQAILNDLNWLEILEIGGNVKTKLSDLLTQTEKQFLIEKIDYKNYI